MTDRKYCKKLIEVDLPIKKISENSCREKSIRHGHISTMHVWWARKPLGCCRSEILASLLPDPCDNQCPEHFIREAEKIIKTIYSKDLNDRASLREFLLKFIADFSNWDLSTNQAYLEMARKLVMAAFENKKPFVVDPFGGGGSIPLEALRVGADAYASDYSPVAYILLKSVMEIIPKNPLKLDEKVQEWANWIRLNTEKELKDFYPELEKNIRPIAYIYYRTAFCEGPGCGVEIPLTGKLILATRKKNRSLGISLRVVQTPRQHIEYDVVSVKDSKDIDHGTMRRGSVTCPVCNYTMPRARVEHQANKLGLGNKLVAVVGINNETNERVYNVPQENDYKAIYAASEYLRKVVQDNTIIPNESMPYLRSIFNVYVYGARKWKDLFNERQLLSIITFLKYLKRAETIITENEGKEIAKDIVTIISLVLDKLIAQNNTLCWWQPQGEFVVNAFGRQALPMTWNYCEVNPFSGASGDWNSALDWIHRFCIHVSQSTIEPGVVNFASATKSSLPDSCVDLVVTDPPYYDAVPYCNLSDFFYVWLRRSLGHLYPEAFTTDLVNKEDELVQLAGRNPEYVHKTKEYFEQKMTLSLKEINRVLKKDGILVVVFAHKTTAGWEALLQAIINAQWKIVASWPIDTERSVRPRAINSATLASSVHLVCRPREQPGISIGDWRDVLTELPKRIHEWMPRLASEGVVGADAIFACLGPALEIYSKYSRVEKANGEKVELREYLEQVWGAVAKEALNMIFQGAHTEGFEEDARITAMWLWTLSTAENGSGKSDSEDESEEDEEERMGSRVSGFTLEYDAARKIAQGLGAHLEDLESVIRVNGDKATLLSVGERIQYLFGKGSLSATPRRKKKDNQLNLFDQLGEVEEQGWSLNSEKSSVGKTVLDKLHQGMILFGAGRADALRRFLVEEGIGKDERFWRLGQALSALYPKTSDEKRWIDGVLARKKSLGF